MFVIPVLGMQSHRTDVAPASCTWSGDIEEKLKLASSFHLPSQTLCTPGVNNDIVIGDSTASLERV